MSRTATTAWVSIREAADELGQPTWRVRRTVDLLAEAGRLTVLRAVRNRMIREDDLPIVRRELQRLGFLSTGGDL